MPQSKTELRDGLRAMAVVARPGFVPIAIFVCAVAYFASASPHSRYGFPLDDGWIHRVYARSFAHGHGFAYNDGEQEAGATSPLWVVVSAPAHWLEPWGEGAVALGVKVMGVVLGIIALVLVQKTAEVLTESRAASVVAASFFAIEPRLLFSALSGMENVLLLALWMGASYAFIRRRWLLSFILLGFMPVTRPEAVIVVLACLLGFYLLVEHDRPLRRAYLWVVPWVPMLLWAIYCKCVNGRWLPNTFYVKATSFRLGLQELGIAWDAVRQHGLCSSLVFFVGIAAYLLWAFTRDDWPARSALLLHLTAAVAYAVGVVATRKVELSGYYWTRWVDPASLILAVATCTGLALLVTGSLDVRKLLPNARPLCIGLGVLGTLCSAFPMSRSLADRRSHLASDSRVIHELNVRAGRWIDANTPEDAIVGVIDAGAIRYFGRRRTIDLVGLNYAGLATGRFTRGELLDEVDWLAVFPTVFQQWDKATRMSFVQRMKFEVEPDEYTIGASSEQATKAIYQRTSR